MFQKQHLTHAKITCILLTMNKHRNAPRRALKHIYARLAFMERILTCHPNIARFTEMQKWYPIHVTHETLRKDFKKIGGYKDAYRRMCFHLNALAPWDGYRAFMRVFVNQSMKLEDYKDNVKPKLGGDRPKAHLYIQFKRDPVTNDYVAYAPLAGLEASHPYHFAGAKRELRKRLRDAGLVPRRKQPRAAEVVAAEKADRLARRTIKTAEQKLASEARKLAVKAAAGSGRPVELIEALYYQLKEWNNVS